MMKFFTPELFVQFNSQNDAEADQANEEWESAIRAYREHLDALRERMPPQVEVEVEVEKLVSLCLHDAEVLSCEQLDSQIFLPSAFKPMPVWTGIFILPVRQDDEVVILNYLLWDRVRECKPANDWPFSQVRLHWLYDEVDVSPDDPGWFLHRVLLSNGSIMKISFHLPLIYRFSLNSELMSDSSRHIA